MEQEEIKKINEDLEMLKKAVKEIKVAINLEPELNEETKNEVKEARKRISDGEYVSNEEMMKEFGLK